MDERFLFRGKRKDNGELVEGYLYITHDGKYEIAKYCDETNIERIAYEVIPKTVDCKALEKQIPKKGIMIGDEYSSVLSCPNCRKPIVNVWNIAKYEPNYCHYCGQALDWSDTK